MNARTLAEVDQLPELPPDLDQLFSLYREYLLKHHNAVRVCGACRGSGVIDLHRCWECKGLRETAVQCQCTACTEASIV